MRILTLDNKPYDLDHLPEEVDDMRFAILDNSSQRNITPSPFVTKAYTDQAMTKTTSEVDSNRIPLLGVRTNKISPCKGTALEE